MINPSKYAQTYLQRIELDNGSVIQYEKLCVCTGGVPKQLFLGYQNVLHIRDTESVHILQEKIKDAKRVLIVGNGGIATEMVYEISGELFRNIILN